MAFNHYLGIPTAYIYSTDRQVMYTDTGEVPSERKGTDRQARYLQTGEVETEVQIDRRGTNRQAGY